MSNFNKKMMDTIGWFYRNIYFCETGHRLLRRVPWLTSTNIIVSARQRPEFVTTVRIFLKQMLTDIIITSFCLFMKSQGKKTSGRIAVLNVIYETMWQSNEEAYRFDRDIVYPSFPVIHTFSDVGIFCR